MQGVVASPLIAWENFYVIVGSAAAALTGLMFVVITLIAGTRARRSSGSIATFGTPTVVHFCVALLIAALLSAPWQALWNVSLPLGLTGLGGTVYVIIVVWRTRHQNTYKPVLEDWLWHMVFPLASYATLIIAGIILPYNPTLPLFAIAAATLLLLFIGIHNSWDTVTYITLQNLQAEDQGQE